MAEPELERLLPYLHQARRSGSLAVGYRAVRRSLKRGGCHLVILARDAGDSLRRLDPGKVPVLEIGDRESLGDWLDRDEVSILGVTDPHLAAGAIAKLERA